MTTRAAFVARARTWIGVPWQHQGRTRAGVDCAGLCICVGRELALDVAWSRLFDNPDYAFADNPAKLTGLCEQHLQPVALADAAPGDLVAIVSRRVPHHIGILGDYLHGGLSLIHSLNLQGRKVVEHRLDPSWRARIVAVYAIPGLEA